MANLNETDQWETGVYQLEEDDPVLGGPSGIDNRPPRELANRTRYQRVRNVTPWDPAFSYPANVAYVSYGGVTWKSVADSLNIPPGTDATKWTRWGHTAAELTAALGDSMAVHEAKANPHPLYATDADLAAHVADADPHPQYASDAEVLARWNTHLSDPDPHPMYAFRGPFNNVPTVNIGPVITVQTPHIRQMIWNGTAYVRAPWHQPGMVLYSYDNPSSIPGYLPIRADVSYNQANYPDLVARLGLSGTGTFSLVELRGEFIRCLDNGRGVNASRVLRSAEAAANNTHTHGVTDPAHGHYVNDPGHLHGGWTDSAGSHNHGMNVPAQVADSDRGTSNYSDFSIDSPRAINWDGAHAHNVGIDTRKTGIYLNNSATGISINADGSEARPRNVAFPAWMSY
ncbi:hypothetical protein [Variovorax sp. V15]|uniref:hypothetical protein n=1 Tax=Variovorax sp. V15 TaxID=3065952 RepID=UPI0034E8DF39